MGGWDRMKEGTQKEEGEGRVGTSKEEGRKERGGEESPRGRGERVSGRREENRVEKRVWNFQNQRERPDQAGMWGSSPRAERVRFRWAGGC